MTARHSRLIAAPPQSVWAVVSDPYHFSRWWPGVIRVEGVRDEHFTQVYTTKRGRAVRMDFRVTEAMPPANSGDARFAFEQEIPGTPFERVLNRSLTQVALEPSDHGTRVTISQQQRLRGYSRTGGWLLRRATGKRLREALEGLALVCA